jgi:mitochondrial import receptor subunit TOM70
VGVALYKSGDISGADAVFQTAISIFPDSPEIYNYYGEIQLDRQDFENGISLFPKIKHKKLKVFIKRKKILTNPSS